MNIFVIPSWYPTLSSPISGIFFKEQVEYLAEEYTDINFGISTWGQSDQALHITKETLSKALHKLSYFGKQKSQIHSIKPNLLEFYCPSISWSPKIFAGNIKQIIKSNHANLVAFKEKVGKVDMIHAHVGYPGGYIAMELAKHYNIPYIITEHMGPFPFPQLMNRKGELKKILHSPLKNADKVIAVSPALASTIASYGIEKPLYIPNVVDGEFFKIGTSISPENFTFFTLCTISTQKGTADLLRAAKILIANHPKAQLKIGGGSSQLEEFKSLSTQLGLQNNISWLGPLSRERAKEEYMKCHAFILTSHYETFGVVYAEAIACGKPIIATKCGGPEVIVNHSNGLLVDIGDIEGIADSMAKMMENYQDYDQTQIRKDFELRFSKGAVLPQIVDVYKSIVCAESVE